MIFYNKLAKLGKGQAATCKQMGDDLFFVYISDGDTILKTLQEDNKVYTLSAQKKQYTYHQIVCLKPGYLLARIDNQVSIIKED